MPKQRQLTKEELAKPFAKYFDRPMTPAPKEIYDFLIKGPIDPKDALPIKKRNDILKKGYLPAERGWCIMPDGSAFVAGLTKMPSVTTEMIAWWFAWHGLENLRYMIWDPDDHHGIHVRPEDLKHRLNYSLSDTERNWGTTDIVIEDVGGGDVELHISFMSPADFGYDMDLFKKEKVLIAVNAVASSPVFDGKPMVSFSHVGREIPGGIELRSRFWIGWAINNRKAVRVGKEVPRRDFEGLARGLAYHCPKEYYNLAAILPGLYAENSGSKDDIKDFG
jgi:phloretin hydrolase